MDSSYIDDNLLYLLYLGIMVGWMQFTTYGLRKASRGCLGAASPELRGTFRLQRLPSWLLNFSEKILMKECPMVVRSMLLEFQ